MSLRLVLLGVVGVLALAGCADESARPVLGPAQTVTTVQGSTDDVSTTTLIDPTAGLTPFDGFEDAVLSVFNEGQTTQLPVLYAASIDARRRGLMEVTDLAGYAGMVFVFDAETEAAFWMRNTPMPLTIAFVRADGSIVSISDMEPCPDVDSCPTYPPEGPYRWALEVTQGSLTALGITESTLLGLS